MEREDQEIIRRCVGGEKEAFNTLVTKYGKRVFNLSYRLVGNRETAEDLAQDIFLRAYEKLAKFRGKSSFYTWLYRVGVNLWKSKYAGSRTFLGFSLSEETNQLQDPSPSPQEKVMKNEEREIVQEAIGQLSPVYRVVIVLRDMEGKNYKEIAKILNVPQGTVKSRIARSRENLRNILLQENRKDALQSPQRTR